MDNRISIIFINMKYIITEEQYSRLPEVEKSLRWIRRRYNLVLNGLEETLKLMKSDICKINKYEVFEYRFFSVFMDCLHTVFYDDGNFSNLDYDTMYNALRDLFYVNCTEFYFNGRENC